MNYMSCNYKLTSVFFSCMFLRTDSAMQFSGFGSHLPDFQRKIANTNICMYNDYNGCSQDVTRCKTAEHLKIWDMDYRHKSIKFLGEKICSGFSLRFGVISWHIFCIWNDFYVPNIWNCTLMTRWVCLKFREFYDNSIVN